MLARFVLYRRANKRRKESDLLALLARWSAKLGSEFFCLSFVRKDTRALVRVVYVGKFCRLQARDQEEEGQRIARLAGQMARQARV